MANVLITGGSGLIGWRAVEQLLGDGHDVVVFDLYPNRDNLAPFADDVEVVAGDVTDLTSLLRTAKRHRTERILHLAAAIAFQSAASPARAISDNVTGTANVFEVALALEVQGVAWASTVAVNETRPDYDGGEVTEDYRGSPTQPYGVSKLACEIIARIYREQLGLNATGIRPTTAYGIGRLSGGVGLVNTAVHNVAVGRPGRFPSWDPIPTQPIYNRDMAAMFIAAMFSDGQPHTVLNTPVLRNYTAAEMADVLRALRPDADVGTEPYPDLIPPPPASDASAARAALAFEPRWSLEQSFAEMLEHFEREAATALR
jgi:UDP-glucose 4-epimerase